MNRRNFLRSFSALAGALCVPGFCGATQQTTQSFDLINGIKTVHVDFKRNKIPVKCGDDIMFAFVYKPEITTQKSIREFLDVCRAEYGHTDNVFKIINKNGKVGLFGWKGKPTFYHNWDEVPEDVLA
jgi:hypothetical protein